MWVIHKYHNRGHFGDLLCVCVCVCVWGGGGGGGGGGGLRCRNAPSSYFTHCACMSPRIKSISNDLDITRFTYSRRNCRIPKCIAQSIMSLWPKIQAEEVRPKVDVPRFYVMQIIESCLHCRYWRYELFMRSFVCYFGVCFRHSFTKRERNTNVTLSWAQNPLSYSNPYCPHNTGSPLILVAPK